MVPKLKKAIIHGEADLDHLTLPTTIREIIAKALQKKPYMRFVDAQQMMAAVQQCEADLVERARQFS